MRPLPTPSLRRQKPHTDIPPHTLTVSQAVRQRGGSTVLERWRLPPRSVTDHEGTPRWAELRVLTAAGLP